jgi:thiamine pyrophosphate-dependent acetolactate synthase large subunit-like protein
MRSDLAVKGLITGDVDYKRLRPQRREILTELKSNQQETDLVMAALAGTTAETYQVLDRPGNLYLVGMGMVSQVALGLATALPSCRVFAFDTDGSMLLAPSILPVVGSCQPSNLYIVVFDNEQLFGSRGGRITHRSVDKTEDVQGAILSAAKSMNSLQAPVAILFGAALLF